MKFRFPSLPLRRLFSFGVKPTAMACLAFACSLIVIGSDSAWARGGGVASESCSGCHRGGSAPTVTITPDMMTPMPGQRVRLSLAFQLGSARNLGFYVKASTGTLAPVAGERTKAFGEGVAHASPIAVSDGQVTVHADWTAPATPGGVDFRVAMVGGSGDGRSSGDGSGTAFLSIAFGCSGGQIYYRDFDGDGLGFDEAIYTRSCGKPEGYAEKVGDCDDNDQKVFPGATEICNKRDDDCDGTADEGLEDVVLYPDKDGDGWGRLGAPDEIKTGGCRVEAGWGIGTNDCDDTDPKIFPGAPEICNLKDDDCDRSTDEGARAACGEGWCRRLAPTCEASSCVPGPPRKEICNLFDDDCDGEVDEEPNTLCGEDSVCTSKGCVAKSEVQPGAAGASGSSGEAGGQSGSSPNEGSSGCSYLPRPDRPSFAWPSLGLAALAWLLRRRPA